MKTAIVVTGLALCASAVPLLAQGTLPPDPIRATFGLVGIGRGQSARVHVLWGDPHLPPNPCHVSVAFVDAAGAPVVDPRGRAVAGDGSVKPGEAFRLDVPGVDLMGDRGRRAVRVVVTGLSASGDPHAPPNPCKSLVPTLELYDDDSLATEAFYAPAAEQAPPVAAIPPDPVRPATFGVVTLVRGQVARLNLAWDALPPGPTVTAAATPATCRVGLAFLDDKAQLVYDQKRQPLIAVRDLRPGAATALDAIANDLLTDGAHAAYVRAVVIAGVNPGPPTVPPNPCYGIVPTLELVDAGNARTSLVYAPAPRFLPAVQ